MLDKDPAHLLNLIPVSPVSSVAEFGDAIAGKDAVAILDALSEAKPRKESA